MSPACSALITMQSLTELQICFYNHIMFKARCHYFIQEINLLHKKAGLINPFCKLYVVLELRISSDGSAYDVYM